MVGRFQWKKFNTAIISRVTASYGHFCQVEIVAVSTVFGQGFLVVDRTPTCFKDED